MRRIIELLANVRICVGKKIIMGACEKAVPFACNLPLISSPGQLLPPTPFPNEDISDGAKPSLVLRDATRDVVSGRTLLEK